MVCLSWLAVSAAVVGIFVAAEAIALPAIAALPASGVSQPLLDASALPVVRVHGCHFDMGPGMEPDRANGPHYHNRECNVVRTGPSGGYGGAPQPRSFAPPPRYEPPGHDNRPRGYGYDDGPRRGGYRGEGGYRGDGGSGRGYGYAPPARRQVCRERCRYTEPFKNCRTVCE